MATANEKLQTAAISHQVDLQHYSNSEVRKIIALLNKADASLMVRLQDALDRLGPDSFTAKHIDSVLANVRELNRQAFGEAAGTLTVDMEELAQYELSYQDQLFTAVVPATVLQLKPLASVTMQQVRDVAFKRPFQGRLLSEWMSSLEAGRASQIRDAIRVGMVEGLTVSQMVQRIRGTRAEGYADGLLNRSRQEIEAVVRTAIGHVSNSARDAFYDANEDIIESQDWLSTLDGRTSPPCRLRDGLRYKPGNHAPIGHSVPWLSGPGRLHWQCRSTSVPRLKLWSELGIDPKDMPPATRASMDGSVPAETTYSEWLKGQSTTRQDEILGKDKGALFRTGKLPLDRFYNDKGKVLTLEQLKAKEPVAYQRAGL